MGGTRGQSRTYGHSRDIGDIEAQRDIGGHRGHRRHWWDIGGHSGFIGGDLGDIGNIWDIGGDIGEHRRGHGGHSTEHDTEETNVEGGLAVQNCQFDEPCDDLVQCCYQGKPHSEKDHLYSPSSSKLIYTTSQRFDQNRSTTQLQDNSTPIKHLSTAHEPACETLLLLDIFCKLKVIS